MQGATGVTLQLHQILRLPWNMHLIIAPRYAWSIMQWGLLPGKLNLMIDPRNTWNIIYIARSNKGYPLTSPNTAPATKWLSWLILVTFETLFTWHGATDVVPSNLTKYGACREKWHSMVAEAANSWKVIKNAGTIRPWSERDPRMIRPWTRQSATRLATEVTFRTYLSHLPRAFSIALQLSFQISPNIALATKSNNPTSPNTAPATKNHFHEWSSSHVSIHYAVMTVTLFLACWKILLWAKSSWTFSW